MSATLAVHLSPARADVINFAQRMCEVGEVIVSSQMHPDVVENRVAIHDPESPGFTVVFITVVDGIPETTALNFDMSEADAATHLIHDDGLGITLRDAVGRSIVQYRIG